MRKAVVTYDIGNPDPEFWRPEFADEDLTDVAKGAALHGWSVYQIGAENEWRLISEPQFFPPEEPALLRAAARAMWATCPDACPYLGTAHPLLQVSEHCFYKLCTLDALQIFKGKINQITKKEKINARGQNDHNRKKARCFALYLRRQSHPRGHLREMQRLHRQSGICRQ